MFGRRTLVRRTPDGPGIHTGGDPRYQDTPPRVQRTPTRFYSPLLLIVHVSNRGPCLTDERSTIHDDDDDNQDSSCFRRRRVQKGTKQPNSRLSGHTFISKATKHNPSAKTSLRCLQNEEQNQISSH